MDMRLCLFCGGPGHTAQDCSKSTSRTAKGRVATVAPEAKQEASIEAKKISPQLSRLRMGQESR
jgi:hypothetical protein